MFILVSDKILFITKILLNMIILLSEALEVSIVKMRALYILLSVLSTITLLYA